MKLYVYTAFVVAATSVVAQPHGHAHRHFRHGHEKRTGGEAAVYAPGPVETVVVYMLNGQQISEQEVRQGIANGTLIWGEDGTLSSTVAIPTPTQTPISTPEQPPAQPLEQSSQAPPPQSTSAAVAPSSAQVEVQASPTPEPQPSPNPAPEPSPEPAPAPPTNQEGGYDGIDKEFPDGKFPCGTFPEGYGATPIEHAGLGGWIGIQDPQVVNAAGYDDITTVPQGSCSGGNCCQPGAFCSYSCPPAYLKASWPELQGAKNQSVGGLYCNEGGKLEMATGSIAKTLCVKGTDKITIKVENKLSSSQSICRTDYPGTESETIPITTKPGESAELACPDNSLYYHWLNKPTSAQYYINPKGVAESEACQWGDGQKPVGNWAPVNLGVGYDSASQKGYISLFPNAPTNPDSKLDFGVEFVADDMSGRCKYANGQYYSGDNYGQTSKDKGCTVAVNSGTLTVVLTDN